MGRVNEKVLPDLPSLSHQILPPCNSTMERAIARPRPLPPLWRSPAVVRWNREALAPLAGAPLADKRVHVIQGDVGKIIEKSEARYDAILLDVDNGPEAFTTHENRRLYTAYGLGLSRRALRPNGIFAVWSAFEDPEFANRLRVAGFHIQTRRVRAQRGGGGRHVLWLGRAGHIVPE